MSSKRPPGPVHRIPADLKSAIDSDAAAREGWGEVTPLGRNEWICWVNSAKLAATRQKRIGRALEDLSKGKKRPCCWPGCPHRRPTAKKWFK